MKTKTIAAAVGTTALGVVAATAGGAAPAYAAPAPADCTTTADHVPTSGGTFYDDSYFDCVPLYGVGKVEFDINSDVPFPDEFALSDEAVTEATSSTGAEGNAYLLADPFPAGFASLSEVAVADGTPTQTYQGQMIFAISSVLAVDPAAPPAECAPGGTETYAQAYTVAYDPTTVDFVTTVGESTWEYSVSSAPTPLTLYMNIAGDGSFDAGAPQCATNGADSVLGMSDAEGGWSFVTNTNASRLSPFPLALAIGGGGETAIPIAADLGEFADEVETAEEPAPEPEPELAETGGEIGLPATAGGVLAVLGAALIAIRRRARA